MGALTCHRHCHERSRLRHSPYKNAVQLRVACQRPLQLPPDNFAVHRPEPEPAPSEPVPLATEPPAEIRTWTAPPPLTRPEMSKLPAEEMRPPATLKG